MTRTPNTDAIARPPFAGYAPAEIGALINEDVVSAHVSEATFLYTQRTDAVRSRQYTLVDLADLDERLDAHIDGLRLAGAAVWPELRANLHDGPGETFAAAVWAVRTSAENYLDEVLEATVSDQGRVSGFIGALGWSEWARISDSATAWLEADDPVFVRVGLAAHRLHRRPPPEAPLARALASASEHVLAEAVRLCGELKLHRFTAVIAALPGDGPVAWPRARSLALLGPSPAELDPLLRALTERGSRHSEAALALRVARLPPPQALSVVSELIRTAGTRRLGLCAAEAAGYGEMMPLAIEQMHDPLLARSAGATYTTVTGADLDALELTRDTMFAHDEDADEELNSEDPEENLPWPDAEKVAAHWRSLQPNYPTTVRHLMGLPVEPGNLRHVLQRGSQALRRMAAFELALREQETRPYCTSKPGRIQARELLGWP